MRKEIIAKCLTNLNEKVGSAMEDLEMEFKYANGYDNTLDLYRIHSKLRTMSNKIYNETIKLRE
jgi:hypothetical protein